jgi:hypothetical protein
VPGGALRRRHVALACLVQAPQLWHTEEPGAPLSRQWGLGLVDRWQIYDGGL